MEMSPTNRYSSFMIDDILKSNNTSCEKQNSPAEHLYKECSVTSPFLTSSPAADSTNFAMSATIQTLFWQQLFLKRKMLMQAKPRKGGQIRFTHRQTVELEKRFKCQKYLAPVDRKQLANHLELSERQVKTWFQNRRAKWRRTNQLSAYEYCTARPLEEEQTTSEPELDDENEI